MKKEEQKVLKFPINSNQIVRKLILSGITLGKGQYGVVQFARDQADPSEVFAVKVIDRKKLTTP